MNAYKWGIVGTNFVSGWFAEAAREVGGARVACVYSRAEETGRAFAQKYGIARVYTDYNAFLSDDDIDNVYIASPNSVHERQAMCAMRAGKPVLCEKPAAPNLKALLCMRECAEQNGVMLIEAMRPAFDPAIRVIEENIARIAPVRRAQIQFCQYSSRYDRFQNGEIMNAFDPRLSNAALMDIGVYCVFVCARLFGMPKSVRADSIFLNNGMEGAGSLLLSYDGMQAVVGYSKINDSALPCEIQGERGVIRFDRVNSPSAIIVKPRGGEEQTLAYTPIPNNMIYEIEAFHRMLADPEVARTHTRVTEIQTRILDMARKDAGIAFPSDVEDT